MKIKNKINCLVVFVATAIFWQPSYVMADQLNISIEKMNELGVNQNTPKKTITGLLTESSGDPIIGATVSVKGTSRGVMTDIDGRYSIEASDGEELVFQLIGFNTETIAVKKDVNVINLRMEASQIELDEVVVVGFGQQKKESVVASLTSIGSKELSVSSRSLTNNIAGKISGVIAVQRSGEPGWDDAQFWIRGVSSYAGGTDPLVLVDGVPRKMNDIDVDEIETFTVLKDASATAVYGAEGANGVILITSKRGKSQKTRINVKLEHGIATPMRLPKLLNSYQYLSLFNEATWNDAGNPLVGFVAPTSDDVLEKYRLGIDPDLYPNANWMDMLRNNTQNQRYTINFRGGGEKVRFFVSGAYYQEDAIYEKNRTDAFDSNAKFERYNLRSNIDFDVTKTTRMSIDMSGQYVNRVAPSQTSDNIFNGMTLFPVHLIPTIYSDGTASEHPESDNQGLRQNPFNFLYFSGYSKSWTSTVQTKVSIDQDLDVLTEGLSIGSMWFMYNYTNGSEWKEKADGQTMLIKEEQFDSTSHDLGFKLFNSFGNGYKFTKNQEYRDVVIQGAKTLSKRFDEKIGSIRSWDWNKHVWQFPVIIDNMMNLELLFEASKYTEDDSFYNIADKHAQTTMKNHFRPDFSSFHVVDYDTISGKAIKRQTFQGYSDPSAWARGQAWALYGYAMTYRYTKNPEYLSQSEGIANFIFTHPNLPKDLIPYWDFNDPTIPNAPRDASAACVIASALYELSEYSETNKEKYIAWADKILENLIKSYMPEVDTHKGFLLLHSTGHLPGGDEIDVPISYADYYFLEALTRRKDLFKNK